ncbi:MAG: type II CAAX prenyl endopeptidase Rce1 family protein [Nodosilinea sp.]
MGHRLVQAATTCPRWSDWWRAAQLTVAFGAIMVPLGLWSHLLTPTPAALPWRGSILMAGRILIIPAILEESFWRVLLLPHRTERVSDRNRWRLGLPMLALFVLMHPFSAMGIYPVALTTFTDPIFLLATTGLGLICTIAYWRSGSGWVPVAMHGLIVWVWIMFLGGYGRLHG